MGKKLICKNLTAVYGKNLVLQNVSFELSQGDFICLCGPNGSGKSTLLTILAGLSNNKTLTGDQLPCIKSDENSAIFLSEMSKKQIAQNIAFMQQSEYSTWDFSVFDMVLQGRFAYSKNGWYSKEDYQIARENLNKLGLADFSQRKVHSLSGGEFQKVRIARALTQTPAFILLDEPASNLDFIYEPQLLEILKKISKENNIGILISIHDINLAARFADKIALLPPGKPLLCNKTEEIFTQKNLSETFSAPIKIYNHPIYNKMQVLYE